MCQHVSDLKAITCSASALFWRGGREQRPQLSGARAWPWGGSCVPFSSEIWLEVSSGNPAVRVA